MKRLAGWIAVVGVLVAQERLPQRQASDAPQSLVLLALLNKEGVLLRQAWGFQVGHDGDVITTVQAVRGVSKGVAIAPTRKQYGIRTVSLDTSGTGLARLGLQIPESERKGLNLGQEEPTTGEDLFVPALDQESRPLLIQTHVVDLRSTPSLGTYFRIKVDKPDIGLATGLPVVSKNGEVVGTVVRQMLEGNHLYMVVPARRMPVREHQVGP